MDKITKGDKMKKFPTKAELVEMLKKTKPAYSLKDDREEIIFEAGYTKAYVDLRRLLDDKYAAKFKHSEIKPEEDIHTPDPQ